MRLFALLCTCLAFAACGHSRSRADEDREAEAAGPVANVDDTPEPLTCERALDRVVDIMTGESRSHLTQMCAGMEESTLHCMVDAEDVVSHQACLPADGGRIRIRPGGPDDDKRALCDAAIERGADLFREQMSAGAGPDGTFCSRASKDAVDCFLEAESLNDLGPCVELAGWMASGGDAPM